MESGKVIGQLDSITKQAEEGANEALSNLEKSISGVESALQEVEQLKAAGAGKDLTSIETPLRSVLENLYAALSAFQFQDINTQKLYKVMSMLGELSDYLNDLVGYPKPRPMPVVAKNIENVDLTKDKSKDEVDQLVNQFRSGGK